MGRPVEPEPSHYGDTGDSINSESDLLPNIWDNSFLRDSTIDEFAHGLKRPHETQNTENQNTEDQNKRPRTDEVPGGGLPEGTKTDATGDDLSDKQFPKVEDPPVRTYVNTSTTIGRE